MLSLITKLLKILHYGNQIFKHGIKTYLSFLKNI